jgi:hypothetical protein
MHIVVVVLRAMVIINRQRAIVCCVIDKATRIYEESFQVAF